MAAFQVFLYGRFWVFTEAKNQVASELVLKAQALLASIERQDGADKFRNAS